MTGLVGYGSSDGEDFGDDDQAAQLKSGVKVWPNTRLYGSIADQLDLRHRKIGFIGLTRSKTVA